MIRTLTLLTLLALLLTVAACNGIDDDPFNGDYNGDNAVGSNGETNGTTNGEDNGAANGASNGDSNGASNGDSNGASNGGNNGDDNGGNNGASNGGNNGDDNGDNTVEPPEEYEFSVQRVFDDVAWLAHDGRAGRAPGTAGNEVSVEYVTSLFEELGLTPAGDNGSFLERFEFEIWLINKYPTLSLDGHTLEAGTAFEIMNYSGSATLEDVELVFAGHGITVPPFNKSDYPNCPLPESGYDDFGDIEVDGKVALMLRRGPAELHAIHISCPANSACKEAPCLFDFGYKANNAALHGAAGAMFVNNYQLEPEFSPGMTIQEKYYNDSFPVAYTDRQPIEQALPDLRSWSQSIDNNLLPNSQLTGVEVDLVVDGGLQTIETHNVLGLLPGKDPELADELIVIGAHVDHLGADPITGEIYNGADDNASGTAVMMEMARAFVLGEHENLRSVLFAAWNAEELGLIGSCFHAYEQPIFPMAQTVAAYSIDMVGAGNGTGMAVFGGNTSPNSWLVDVMRGYSIEEMNLDYLIAALPPIDASDHACYSQQGVSAVLLSTLGDRTLYHTPQDTIDTILMEDLEAAFLLSWAGIYPIAIGIEAPYIGRDYTRLTGGLLDPSAKHLHAYRARQTNRQH